MGLFTWLKLIMFTQEILKQEWTINAGHSVTYQQSEKEKFNWKVTLKSLYFCLSLQQLCAEHLFVWLEYHNVNTMGRWDEQIFQTFLECCSAVERLSTLHNHLKPIRLNLTLTLLSIQCAHTHKIIMTDNLSYCKSG